MLVPSDMLRLSLDALGTHRLRTALTMLGLAMGVATLITVVTLIQGANQYVETKIANLGTDVFQVARTPFATTDFEVAEVQTHHQRRLQRRPRAVPRLPHGGRDRLGQHPCQARNRRDH
jgi:ABC-type lipoprotein release transport system permease subunit